MNAGLKMYYFLSTDFWIRLWYRKNDAFIQYSSGILEHSQISEMELTVKIEQLTIFAINSILDVQLGSDTDAFDAFDTDTGNRLSQ